MEDTEPYSSGLFLRKGRVRETEVRKERITKSEMRVLLLEASFMETKTFSFIGQGLSLTWTIPHNTKSGGQNGAGEPNRGESLPPTHQSPAGPSWRLSLRPGSDVTHILSTHTIPQATVTA